MGVNLRFRERGGGVISFDQSDPEWNCSSESELRKESVGVVATS